MTIACKESKKKNHSVSGFYSLHTIIDQDEMAEFAEMAHGWAKFMIRRYPGYEVYETDVIEEPVWGTQNLKVEYRVRVRKRKS